MVEAKPRRLLRISLTNVIETAKKKHTSLIVKVCFFFAVSIRENIENS